MRYLNWDILIFPDESKVPIQEFGTQCHALAVQSDNLPSSKLITAAGDDYHSSVTQLPTLTCFIASLVPNSPFRLSIHSWEKPKPSNLLLNFKPAAARIAFEAKLFIDRQLKAQKFIGENNAWPEVIDTTGGPTAEYSKELTFPQFHAEILQQLHWDARDGLGRIRIVIAEGVAQSEVCGEARGFHRLRDVVAFSFQHAPRHVLEYSGLAWPNAGMFRKAAPPAPKFNFEAHAHSPQRPSELKTQKSVPAAVSLHSVSPWSAKPTATADDPFVDPGRILTVLKQRKTSTDVSMPDYPASKNPTEMSGVAIQEQDFQEQVSRAAIDEIVRALTPSKRYALLNALSPSKPPRQPSDHILEMTKPMPHNRVLSVKKSFEPALRPQTSIGNMRRASSEGPRSASGGSTVMSWDESPTLADLWSKNTSEFPGLLASIQSSTRSERAISMGAKRKRSLSPRDLLRTGNDALTTNTKGMSTSPCKKTPTPRKIGQDQAARVDTESEEEEGELIELVT